MKAKSATCIPRHVHSDDLKALSEFFFNQEMEDDLVLNLTTEDAVPGSSRTAHVKKGGKWTDRWVVFSLNGSYEHTDGHLDSKRTGLPNGRPSTHPPSKATNESSLRRKDHD